MSKAQHDKTRTNGRRFKGVQIGTRPAIMLLLFLGLSACGNKGDLYVPQKTETPKEATEQKTIKQEK